MAKLDEKGFWINKKGEGVHKDLVRVDKQLEDETVEQLINKAKEVTSYLKQIKNEAFETVESFRDLLLQKYDIDIKKNSKKGNFTIENYSATAKVMINIQDSIAFDNKLGIAKIKIDEYLHEKTKGADPEIQTLINKAFEVDKKGEVSPKKILALKSYDIKHPLWVEAMNIIDEAVEIVSSKSYIRFYERDNIEQEYKQIRLDIAGV